MTKLIAGSDAWFLWMLDAGAPPLPLRMAPGGIAEHAILEMLRAATAEVRTRHNPGDWLIVQDDEVVGLCSLKAPADDAGTVEIGYGIAESRRRRGHATRAVGLLLKELAEDPLVYVITAETAAANFASQRVLEANGFVRTATRYDPEDGDLLCWRLL